MTVLSAVVFVRSAIPGRVRWEAPALIDAPGWCDYAERGLVGQGGVRSVSASATTGRLLLVHDPSYSQQSYKAELERLIREALDGGASRDRCAISTPALCGDPSAPPLLQLLSLTQRHTDKSIVAFVIAFIDRLFEAAPPAMIGGAMDIVTRKSGSFLGMLGFRTVSSQLFAFGGVCLAVWAVDAFMGYLHSVTSSRLANDIEDDLRNQVYAHLQTLDLGQLEGKTLNHWATLFDTDISRIGSFIETGIDPLILMVTNSLIVTTTFLMHSPALFGAQMAIIPGLWLLSRNMLGPIRRRYEIAGQRGEELSTALRGNIAGMSTIAVFGAQEREADRIARLGFEAEDADKARARLMAAYVPALQMMVGAGFLSTLVWGGFLVERGQLSIASYNLMGFSSLRLLVALGTLGTSLAQYQRTSVSVEKIVAFLRTKPALPQGTGKPPAAFANIHFDKVSFAYEPGRTVLENLDLKFAFGRTTGIVGSTGAGKTTALKLLLRFYDPTSGAVRIGRSDIRDIGIDSWREGISFVSQQIFLTSGTIRENIAYSRPDAPTEEVVRAAEAAQALDFIEALPKGFDTAVGENGTVLSQGQRQRIAIARAVLANRRILVFDEATSAVDYETEAAIQRALHEVLGGCTIVLVAHRLSTVRHADWIYVLEDGRVTEEGRHDELVRREGIYANLWRIQTGEKQALPPAKPRKRPK